jgi:tetratricopeptide (TPR) repeat protein
VRRIPQPPPWLPASLHLGHGLLAGGGGYLLAYTAASAWSAEPGGARALTAVAAVLALIVFEAALLTYVILRRRRMKRLWREAADFLRRNEFEAARLSLAQLLRYAEYRMAPQPVLFAMGAAAEAMGDEREALVLYRRCGPFTPAVRAIGLLQLHRGMNDSAAEAFRKLVARRPDDTLGNVLLALALVRGGNAAAAQKVLERAVARRPRAGLLRVNLERVKRGEEPALEAPRPDETP